MSTGISWTDETINPVVGCSKISEGCSRCYAEKMAARLSEIKTTEYYRNVLKWDNGYGGNEFETPGKYISEGWNGKTHFVPSQLLKPGKWKKPKRIFVVSMGDLFHETVKFEWIDAVFSMTSDYDWHTYQLLTKRPERVLDFISWKWDDVKKNTGLDIPWFPKNNIHIGVTVENQEMAEKRIPLLLKMPFHVRFLSCEPLLGNINLEPFFQKNANDIRIGNPIDWVVVGGESGHKARPMHPDWARNLRDQCQSANVSFFFKQWGEWSPNPRFDGYNCQSYRFENGKSMYKIGRKIAGDKLFNKEYKEFPK